MEKVQCPTAQHLLLPSQTFVLKVNIFKTKDTGQLQLPASAWYRQESDSAMRNECINLREGTVFDGLSFPISS